MKKILYAYVDTCVFTDIMRCYDPKAMSLSLQRGKFLSEEMIKALNHVLENEGNIVVSSFLLIELINKFDEMFINDDFKIERLRSLIKQPPEWLIIEDLHSDVAYSSIQVPSYVSSGGISLDDTIHVATAISRGDEMYFLTTDKKLLEIQLPKIKFVS